MSRTVHMRLDIKGALANWKMRDFRGMFKHDDGTSVPPMKARQTLLDELSKGHLYLPIGNCDNFSFTEGCKGHESGEGDTGKHQ